MKTKSDLLSWLLGFAIPGIFAVSTTHAAPDGTPAWTNYYNYSTTAGENDDQATSVAVDNNGNVYVTGSSLGASPGQPFSFTYDYATIKYSNTGVAIWTNRFNGLGNGDSYATSLAVDKRGDVYVTGYSAGAASGNDFATIKYSSAGVSVWTNYYNGAANGNDQAVMLAVAGAGNVYVTGESDGNAGSVDFATIMYSGAGVPLWTNRFHGAGTGVSEPFSLAVDAAGNAAVTGVAANSSGHYDYATIKYSGAGAPLWTNIYDGPGNLDDVPYSVGVDGGGNVYVAGYTTLTGGSTEYATIKYSTDGLPLWTNRWQGLPNSLDYALALAVDQSSNVYVTGRSVISTISYAYAYATIKYSSAGAPLWTNKFCGSANGYNSASAVAVDAVGNVYVTGTASGAGTSYDYATVKYTGGGVPVWTNLFNGAGNGADYATSLAVDGSGNAYVTGYATGSGTGYDYTTIKYWSPPALSFAALKYRSGFQNPQFVFTLTGPADSNAIVSTSSDLHTWAPLFTNRLTGGLLNYTDAPAANPSGRFYRAQLQ